MTIVKFLIGSLCLITIPIWFPIFIVTEAMLGLCKFAYDLGDELLK